MSLESNIGNCLLLWGIGFFGYLFVKLWLRSRKDKSESMTYDNPVYHGKHYDEN